jgi:hypothetical protein
MGSRTQLRVKLRVKLRVELRVSTLRFIHNVPG